VGTILVFLLLRCPTRLTLVWDWTCSRRRAILVAVSHSVSRAALSSQVARLTVTPSCAGTRFRVLPAVSRHCAPRQRTSLRGCHSHHCDRPALLVPRVKTEDVVAS
jgi:hypothetical protein